MTDINSQPNRHPHNFGGGGLLYTAVSYVALSIGTLALPANAQTVINNGTVATTTSANNGETISVESGTFVSIANAPAVVVANNDVRLTNGIGATIATTGQTQTVQVNAGTTGAIISLPMATSRFLGQSRVIDIAGAATLVNNGVILGTGNQRYGTVFVGPTANATVILNAATGVIDAGAGNLGAGFSAELSAAGNAFTITNAGTIAGRGNDGAGLTTAGDGIRLERTRIAGMLDATTTGLFTGTITNSGTISSEGANGTVAGLRVVNGVSFQGTLNNSGTISGTQNGVYFGNSVTAGGAVHTGGVVNNLAGGTISSGSRALNIDGLGLVINNAGRIIGTGNQRNGTVYTDETASSFTLNNQATGIIDAGVGNQGAGYSAETPAAGTSYIITNAGSIIGRGNADAMLTSAGDGLRLERTRGADGLLVPGSTASFSGAITNSGTISSEATNGTVAGLRIVDGVGLRGTITNAATGVISGVQNGVYIGQAAHTGGIINNVGTISSGSRALNIDGTGLVVNNSGRIIGTGNQRNGTAYADDGASGFTLNNAATGVIDAGAGNLGAGFSAELSAAGNAFTITNAGTIAGRGNDGAGLTTAGDGIRLERTRIAGMLDATTTGLFTGTITNSGTISSEGANGTVAGLRVVNGVSFQGTLNNSGTISGTQNGVYFGNSVTAGGAVHTGGVVNNLAGGTISSGSRALNIDGLGLVINNAGRIIGTGNQRNGTVYTDETASSFTLNNQATGIIDAGVGNQGAGYSAETPAAGTSYIITNAGSIIGRGNADAMLTSAGDGLRLERTRGADGLLVPGSTASFSGAITNSGTISSEATNGTVAGLRIVDGVGLRGTITNAATGVISGVQNGVYIGQAAHTGGIINNVGTISSGSRALNIDGTGLVVNNSGRIIGTGNQRNGTAYADDGASGFTLNNAATGVIDAGAGNLGAGFSAELSAAGNAFTITNAGTIAGRGNDGAGLTTAGDGIRLERTRIAGMLDATTTGLFTGTITNSGTISSEGANGTVAGLRVVNGVSFQGTLNNSGTISGTQNGVYFGNSVTAGGAVHTGGVVNNLAGGTISSGSRALNIDGLGLVINNAGRIIGTGNQRNGTVYGDATANNFIVNNQATGLVDVGVGRQGSGVSLQLGVAANDSRTFTITNAGTIAGRGAALPSGGTAGVRLFSDVAGVTASGMITNSGTISAETGAAFLIERVNFNGTITNSGTISGAIAVDASAATGGVRFVQNGGALTGNFVGSNFVDSFTLASGNFALANNFVNGVNVTLANGTTTTVTGARTLSGDLIVNGALNLDLGVSSIEVTGNTTLGAGSRINIVTSTPAGVLRLGQAIDVLTDTGSFINNGALVTVIDDDFLVDYRVTFGSLQVTPVAANLAALSTDGNISAFGGALANALTANQLPAQVFAGLNATTSAAQFEQVALTLLPALNEGAVREIFETQNAADSFVIDRFASAGTGLWGQAIARKADRDAESLSVTGYDADAFGFSIGIDAALGEDIRIGAVYSYANIGVDQQGGGAETSDINASNISGYVGYNSEKGFLNGLVGYSFNRVDTSRGGAASSVTGKFDLKGMRAQANAGYALSLSNIEFTPYVGLNYASLSPDNYTETGGLGLIVDAEKVNYFEGKLGVRLASVSQNSLSIRTNLAYAYDFIGDARNINLSFAGSGSPFRLTSGESTKSRFEFGAGVGYGKQQGFSISLDYQGELASGYNSHNGVLRLRYGF